MLGHHFISHAVELLTTAFAMSSWYMVDSITTSSVSVQNEVVGADGVLESGYR